MTTRNTQTDPRDLTKAQFDAACARRGFTWDGGIFMYYHVGHNTYVSILNAGDNRRAQLAYLIREAAKAAKKAGQS